MPDPKRKCVPPQVYVWDPFVRVFHWTLVAAFPVAYLIKNPLIIHVWVGYLVGVFLAARFFWGFFGSPHALFSDFIYAPTTAFRYARNLLVFRAIERRIGHSPGGGYVIMLMLIFLAATVVTGLMVDGGVQEAGPLAGMLTEQSGDVAGEWHEAFANATLAVIGFHIVGVLLRSFVYRENLVLAMFTGFKRK